MINSIDMAAAAVERLLQGGFDTYSSETDEGFKKPACFADCTAHSVQRVSAMMEDNLFTIKVLYVSKTETQEELLEAENRIKRLFLYNPLEVKDRKVSTYQIDFEREGWNLVALIDYTVTAMADIEEADYDGMENLNLGGI